MEYYLAISGEKVGPLTQFKLVEMLRDGEVSPDQKIWHQGMDNWLPISEVPSLESTVRTISGGSSEDDDENPDEPTPADSPTPPSKKVPVAEEVRPLTRFWARHFDYMLVALAVIVFSDFELPKVDPETSFSELWVIFEEFSKSDELRNFVKLQFYALLMWHVIEGIMIGVFGTTPGKALFGIHVTTVSGEKPRVITGIYRSFLVYILGLGLFYFPIIRLVAMTFSFFRLMSKGITVWDEALNLRVKHPPLSVGRILLAILAFITLMMLQNLNFS